MELEKYLVCILLMTEEADDVGYSEALSFIAFRRCSLLWERRDLYHLCIGEDFDCRVSELKWSSLEYLV